MHIRAVPWCVDVFRARLKTETQGVFVCFAPPGGLNSSYYDTVKPEDISFKIGQEVCVTIYSTETLHQWVCV